MISDLAKQLQADLKARGLYDGRVDGDWGPKSQAAWAAAMALMPEAPPRPRPMTTGPDGIAVMHSFEKCRLEAYPDPALGWARPTIGWGDAGPDIVRGMRVTQEWADARFARRLGEEFEPAVRAAVKVQLTQRQFDALVCWAYNVGAGAPGNSTLVRLLNAGDVASAADEFPKWNKSDGKVMLGLKRRRAAEKALFLGKNGVEAAAIGWAISS